MRCTTQLLKNAAKPRNNTTDQPRRTQQGTSRAPAHSGPANTPRHRINTAIRRICCHHRRLGCVVRVWAGVSQTAFSGKYACMSNCISVPEVFLGFQVRIPSNHNLSRHQIGVNIRQAYQLNSNS